MCSNKLAAPLVFADSAREPASIQTPTVAAPAEEFSSVATVSPLGKLVMRVAEALAAVAIGRTNYNSTMFKKKFCWFLVNVAFFTCLVKPTLA
jgi:hypothetical protein